MVRRRLSPQRELKHLRGQQKILALMSIIPRPPQTKAEMAADKAKRYPEPEIFDVSTLDESNPLQD